MALNYRFFPVIFIQVLLYLLPVKGDDFVVAGYLPDYRSTINVNASALHLTDLMLFSMSPEAVIEEKKNGCCVGREHFELIRKARAYKKEEQNKRLKLWLTIGGGERSDGFKELMKKEKQQGQLEFVLKLLKLCKREQLDGIDFDYNSITETDEWKDYIKFLELTLPIFKNHTQVRKPLMFSMSLRRGFLIPKALCEAIDRVNIQAYDLITRDRQENRKPRHHAMLMDVQEAVEEFLKVCPSTKIVLGIPAYARHAKNSGLTKTYAEIVDYYFGDKKLSAVDGYYFDGPGDVALKVRYAKKAELGGVYIWELGQDLFDSEYEGGELLQAVRDEL